MKTKAVVLTVLALVVAGMFACSKEQAPAPAQKAAAPAEDLAPIATEAYIYGYPLVTMEMTRRAMTNPKFPTL